MRLSVVKPGDEVEITMVNRQKEVKTYKTLYETEIDDKHCLVNLPVEDGHPVKLSVNGTITVVFFTAHGMIQYSAIVKGYENQGGLVLAVLQMQSKGERIQRRNYFRFDCSMSLVYYISEDENGNILNTVTDKKEMSKAEIVEISGGGFKFTSYGAIPEKSVLTCSIIIENSGILALAEIIQMSYDADRQPPYLFRTKFVGIKEEDQEVIVQYIFDRQRKVVATK